MRHARGLRRACRWRHVPLPVLVYAVLAIAVLHGSAALDLSNAAVRSWLKRCRERAGQSPGSRHVNILEKNVFSGATEGRSLSILKELAERLAGV